MSEESKPKKEYVFTPLKKQPEPVVRAQQGRFAPGISGNPGGKPKMVAEVRELAQKRSKEAMELVYSIMVDENNKPGDRLAAIRVILQAAGAMIQVRENKEVKEDELSEISAEDLKVFLQKADIKS